MVQASGEDASWSSPKEGVPDTSCWEEARTQQVHRGGSLGPPLLKQLPPRLEKQLTMDGWMELAAYFQRAVHFSFNPLACKHRLLNVTMGKRNLILKYQHNVLCEAKKLKRHACFVTLCITTFLDVFYVSKLKISLSQLNVGQFTC